MLTAFMVLMVVFSNAAGDVFLTRGMKQVGDVSVLGTIQLFQTIKRIVSNLNFVLGVACLAVSFFSFLTVLSWANLSFVVPATAIVYVVTVLGAKFFLGEQIDSMRWAGTFLVCLGVALICLPEDNALSVSMLIGPARMFLGILTAASVCYYIVSVIAAERFFAVPPDRPSPPFSGGEQDPQPPPFSGGKQDPQSPPFSKPVPAGFKPGGGQGPSVSILVPLCGADFRAYQNYASLCRQDYPEFEIIFGASNSKDSSLPVISRLQADFPHIPIRVVIDTGKIGPNPKVNTLNNMVRQAGYQVLLLLDSDIRVGPDFIRVVCDEVGPGAEGLVTCLYRAGEAPGVPSKLEAVGISSEFAPGVLVAQMAGGISFAFGAAIALSRKTLDAIGGFAAIAPYLADDYMLGNLVRKAGLPVMLSRYVVETFLSKLTIRGFVRHQLRWARGIRACAPWGQTGSLIANGTALSFLYLTFSGFSSFGFLVFASVTALRLWMAWMVGVRRLGDDILRKNLLLVPLRDFFSLFIWAAAPFGNRVQWRDRVFLLEKNGTISEL
ncbi:MAG TPA: bacteriohopanetetrol glucosamine biosynthesis glycosyltransferase HpnI [Syntrophobacteraceae bacterium]|nr:bacteriohopanetetrol glucosamine biosynthesis glycosyltransferase HpnI [Syntrophobacteraceae bacterium]